jgi:hypothetical protein
MKHVTKLMVAGAGIALLIAGCSTGTLPRGARLVGGGLKIDWSTEEVGTVILVERTTGKTVATESINGSHFEFDISEVHNARVVQAIFGGAPPTNAQFSLYFVPDRH